MVVCVRVHHLSQKQRTVAPQASRRKIGLQLLQVAVAQGSMLEAASIFKLPRQPASMQQFFYIGIHVGNCQDAAHYLIKLI